MTLSVDAFVAKFTKLSWSDSKSSRKIRVLTIALVNSLDHFTLRRSSEVTRSNEVTCLNRLFGDAAHVFGLFYRVELYPYIVFHDQGRAYSVV